ncbi:hypothetical protein [Collimonas fungivorans]|uniref:hypothetical protein n=1 Tax=Collimonas fungivorans TaxID=158899 RepID=UPI00059F1630|nr:hypothetical protein [Collimonas fungivorans]
MKLIERFCWVFFAACALVECHWVLHYGIKAAGWKEPDANGWASWVQAVGSIFAIAGACGIAIYQRFDERRVRAEEQTRSDMIAARICHKVATDACLVLYNIAKKFEERLVDASIHIGAERIEDVQFSLRTLARKELAADLYSLLLELQREVAYTLTDVRRESPLDPDTHAEVCRKSRARHKKGKIIRDAIGKIAAEYGVSSI